MQVQRNPQIPLRFLIEKSVDGKSFQLANRIQVEKDPEEKRRNGHPGSNGEKNEEQELSNEAETALGKVDVIA